MPPTVLDESKTILDRTQRLSWPPAPYVAKLPSLARAFVGLDQFTPLASEKSTSNGGEPICSWLMNDI